MFDEAGEDRLLLAAVTRLGAAGGAVGGALGGAAGGYAGASGSVAVGAGGAVGGARGGARGAARGYARMKPDVETAALPFAGPPAAAYELICRVLNQIGSLVGASAGDGGDFWIRAMVGVGLGNLNPTVVTVQIMTQADGATLVNLRAAGREGLIKRHPAARSLERVVTTLQSAG